MAKLVIGTSKQTVVPAVVRDVSPAHYVEKAVDANGKLRNGTNIMNFNGVRDITGTYTLFGQYYNVTFPANTILDMSSVVTISGSFCCNYAFADTKNLIHADLSSLVTISGNTQSMFSGSDLKTINLSSLTTISSYNGCQTMFYGSKLETIDLSSLTTISGSDVFGNTFVNCHNLTSFKANKLNVISLALSSSSLYCVFGDCEKLETVEFGGLTASTFSTRQNQFRYLFNNTTGSQAPNGCTVHFPSNFDPRDPNHTFDASTLSGYPTFGGSASYIHLVFDLPATE